MWLLPACTPRELGLVVGCGLVSHPRAGSARRSATKGKHARSPIKDSFENTQNTFGEGCCDSCTWKQHDGTVHGPYAFNIFSWSSSSFFTGGYSSFFLCHLYRIIVKSVSAPPYPKDKE